MVQLEALAEQISPDAQLLVICRTPEHAASVHRLVEAGLTGVSAVESSELESGDVVKPLANGKGASVFFRESDRHHALFLTNRCNSNCLMCSQPPTPQRDDWLVDEAIDIVGHIQQSPRSLGLTGGEPLLLEHRLRKLLEEISVRHPRTSIDVLTNGRLLGNDAVAGQLLDDLGARVSWLVPLYGHADFLHDFVVQAKGAFEETIGGLLNLQQHAQPIQLRIVLIEPVLQNLVELCTFIGRNLPFVREVALMGCEPIGFALANRELCAVDLGDWQQELQQATRTLRRFAVPFVIMNVPLCALPESLWPDASRSISDWKNVYASECSGCEVKADCCGLFAWHETGWQPAKVHAIRRRPTTL